MYPYEGGACKRRVPTQAVPKIVPAFVAVAGTTPSRGAWRLQYGREASRSRLECPMAARSPLILSCRRPGCCSFSIFSLSIISDFFPFLLRPRQLLARRLKERLQLFSALFQPSIVDSNLRFDADAC